MPASETRLATPNASRYLQQLCKHWSHKFDVAFTPEQGRIPFAPDRTCTLQAADGRLTMKIETADTETLARMETVVIDHLKRFAFKEELGDIQWVRAA